MNMARSLWSSVQGDPVFMRRVNGWLTIFWVILIPIAELTNWVNANGYISRLSEIALVLGSWSAWQASRVEVFQQVQEENNKRAAVAEAKKTAKKVAEDQVGPEK